MFLKPNIHHILIAVAILFFFDSQAQSQIGTDIDGESGNDRFGWSVSMSDSHTLAVGAIQNDGAGNNSGHVRVFRWNGSLWEQKGADINGESSNDNSGYSVSLPDSNTVGIGAYRNDGNGQNSGQVRVYSWIGGAWIQKGIDIDGEAIGDELGTTISMPDANTIAIGAPKNDGNGIDAGHARVYQWDGNAWVQKGADLNGAYEDDNFGRAISMPDGNTLAVSSKGNIFEPGEVYIYEWIDDAWQQKGSTIVGEAAFDLSGHAISMPSPNCIAVGSTQNAGNGFQAGHVRIFEWDGADWIQKGLDIDGEAAENLSGNAVSMPDELTVAIGANWNSDNGTFAGHVRVYRWNGNAWLQDGDDIDGEAEQDQSGYAVDMPNSSTLAIGAFFNSGNGFGAGHVRVFSLCDNGSSDVITACDEYTWMDGNTYTESNNSATWVLPNALGCDSLITLDLTINSVFDLGITLNENTIEASNENASYAWLDCDNDFAFIPGENGQFFTPTSNGNYALQLTENNCVAITDCLAITTIGMLESDFSSQISVFPNPNDGNFSIDLGDRFDRVSIRIFSSRGDLILGEDFVNRQVLQFNMDATFGLYFVSVQFENHFASFRLMIH